MIFNHRKIQALERIRNIFLSDTDFESVYHKIMEGSYTTQEKEATKDAITEAYNYIDNIVKRFSFNRDSPYPINIYKVQAMINAFAGNPGFIFTLNQDLFLERKYCNGERPVLPGIKYQNDWFTTNFFPQLSSEQYISLPSINEVIIFSKNFKGNKLSYIKLHGSCNWTSSIHGNQMVIGRNKTEQINEEPLLRWYFDIFKEVLFQPNCKLLSIGYGFGDEHINDVLYNAINKYGLRISIISPLAPPDFRTELMNKKYGAEIWNGLGGYYNYTLAELFPANQSESMGWQLIQDRFFERKIVP